MAFTLFSENFRGYFTFQRDWKGDIAWGAVFAVAFILLNLLIPSITIGFPVLPQATQGERASIIMGVAPFSEDLLFVGVFQPAIDMGFASPFAVLVTGGVFSMMHAKAYAGSFTLQGIQAASDAFLGAFIFRVLTGFLILWRKSFYTGWTAHFLINGFLFMKFVAAVLVLKPI